MGSTVRIGKRLMAGVWVYAIILCVPVLVLPLPLAAAGPPLLVLTLDGAVGPASADYVTRGLARADKEGVQLVVLQMDTPGGLDTSMRQIIKAILASPIPVASFVAPSGARAASAGTYILYASHIAAMAPGTNLGAATPVELGGAPEAPEPQVPLRRRDKDDGAERDQDKEGAGEKSKPPSSREAMSKKQVNDAAAYIRGLAQLRGRNVEWADRAVREAVSLSAEEALRQKVVDYIGEDLNGLVEQLDGKTVKVLEGDKTLRTKGSPQLAYEPDWRTRLLAVITNPSIALILMMIGIYGLFFEFSNPGFVAPGVVGAICLLLALFALQLLPVNYAGLGLILLGLIFMVAEAFFPSFGALGIGGVAAFVIGAVILMDTEAPGFGIPLALVGAVAVVSALFMATIGGMAIKARRRPIVSGREELIGSLGEVMEAVGTEGWARVHGELWRVRSSTVMAPGDKVRVTGMEGLTLEVSLQPSQQKGD